MAIVKRTNSNYVITAPTSGSNITLQSETVRIDGNLIINGSQTTVNSVDTLIADNNIVLNADWPISSPPTENAGLTVNRGSSANVAILWNESLDKWQITSNVSNSSAYSNIASSSGTGILLENIVEDLTPQLGGDLDVNGKTIFAATNNVQFSGNLQLNNTVVVPTSAANATVLYANTPAAGTTGLYVVNNLATNEELVTKKRAFGFSLIL